MYPTTVTATPASGVRRPARGRASGEGTRPGCGCASAQRVAFLQECLTLQGALSGRAAALPLLAVECALVLPPEGVDLFGNLGFVPADGFLCSADASYVTGSFYTVDGGMTNY